MWNTMQTLPKAMLMLTLMQMFPSTARANSHDGYYLDATEFALDCSNTLTSIPDVTMISQDNYADYLHSLCSSAWNCPKYAFTQLPLALQVIFAGSTCANIQPVHLSPTCPSYMSSNSYGGVPDMAIYLGEERPVMDMVSEQVFFLCYDSFDDLVKYDFVRILGGE